MEFIQDILKIIWDMVREGFSGIMDKCLKVIGKMARKMVKEYGYLQKEIAIRVNGWMADSMATEFISIKIVLIKASLQIVWKMATDSNFLQMEIVSKDITRKESHMVMEDMNGTMVVSMKDNLNVDIEMAKEF